MTGAERRDRLAATRVLLLVTEAVCHEPWEEAVASALSSGAIGIVQLREKDLDDAAFLARARRLGALARAAGALLILNDRVHLVAAAGADGAHVGEDDLPPTRARALLGPDAILGVSTHDAAEVAAAAAQGADYVGLGPCFPTTTKRLARPPGGARLVRACLGASALSCFPIGGITPARAEELAAAGARRVAVSASILGTTDPAAAARALLASLDHPRTEPGSYVQGF